MDIRETCAKASVRAMAAVFAAAVSFAAFAPSLPAQRMVEVPRSTTELPGDRGVRAHSNHLILLRPERIREARSQTPVGDTPGSLACVYQISSASLSTGCPITGNLASGNNGLPNPTGGSETIAIVDAYDYPTALNDITVFSNQFGLPAPCSATVTANCFSFAQVYAAGTKPAANSSWALEESLDIEWAHAMAPHAKIVLVEASSSSFTALFQAVTVASAQVTENGGMGEVSMSWGGSEFSTEASYDSYFKTAGVVYVAAAGDTGGQTIYPSVSPNVVSAGGTSVNRTANGQLSSETTWTDGGGGPSFYEPVPSYQKSVENLVGSKRGSPDLSFDANPNTGVFIYDSTAYDGSAGWWIIGGTSVASPSLAGIVNSAASFYHSFQSGSAAELTHIYSICDGPRQRSGPGREIGWLASKQTKTSTQRTPRNDG